MQDVRARLRERLGDGPAADLLAAQIALETADGQHAYSYNFGNRKASDKPGQKYMLLDTWELVDGKRVDMREPFIAHDSVEEGIDAQIEYLDQKGLLDVADSGDVDAFSRALKAANYYTAEEPKYRAQMRKRLARWAKE